MKDLNFKKSLYDAALSQLVYNKNEDTIEPGTKQAFAELNKVLLHCTDAVLECIPQEFMNFLSENMDPDWNGSLDFSKQLMDMDLLSETRTLLSLVYRDFICSEKERRELIEQDRKELEASGLEYEDFSLKDLFE